jgi:hypothetical protein
LVSSDINAINIEKPLAKGVGKAALTALELSHECQGYVEFRSELRGINLKQFTKPFDWRSIHV